VITTRNAGSVVRDRSDGYIVPIRSADALVERIAQLAGDIDLLSGMSRNALERASEFTPDGYARRLALAVRTVSSERGTRNEEKGKGQGVSGKRMERMKAET